jgi:hypothetical protein
MKLGRTSLPRPTATVVRLGVALLAVTVPAHAAPILHEQIPEDARIDIALGAVVAGEIPAVVETPSGFLGAPDPRRPTGASDQAYGSNKSASVPGVQSDQTYVPDRDTRRPESLPYDDPFTPSTAPFKRLVAFDAVKPDFSLTVARPELKLIPRASQADTADDRFFADMVIDAQPGTPVRIPSVGPDSRLLHAHLASGPRDLKFRLLRDEADNWFIDVPPQPQGLAHPGRSRLVMDLAIRRATFGGELGKAQWSELPRVAALPPNVAASARLVADRIGVAREGLPRDAIKKLVGYFRSFRESDEPPKKERDVYVDIALSQKGVCRHRAFSFLITALGLGIPTRMVMNEAHAWVEVHDGRLWRRIDLGGAGRMLAEPIANRAVHEPPVDPFGWPAGATRGEDIAGLPRPNAPDPATGQAGGNSGRASGASGAGASAAATASGSAAAGAGGPEAGAGAAAGTTTQPTDKEKDTRPPSSITLALDNPVVQRGMPFKVRGHVSAAKEPCGYVTVEILFRGGGQDRRVGSLATDARGEFAGSVTIPPALGIGDYDLVARTEGDLRCGATK